MGSEANFERGLQLFEMGRFKDAIPYLQNALAVDIDNFETKFLLAQSYLQTDKTEQAKTLTLELRSKAPNYSGIYYLLSKIYFLEENMSLALELIDEAISLDPYDEDYFGHKSYIRLHEKKYEEALLLAEEGLKLNAKSIICLNARATALTKLKRKEEARETIENLLNDDPENAYSHANIGWNHLEHNDTSKALTHFKEALKLDPNDDYARNGMITAVKSKNKIYNLYLRYAFWIGNQSQKNQWIFIIGIYLIYRFSLKILTFSGLSILAIPLIIAYLLFALGSWIMEPLSNMILLSDNYGKYLLDKNSRLSGQILFVLLLLSLLSFCINFIFESDYLILFSIASLAAILPLTRSPLSSNKNAQLLGYIYGIVILLIPIIGGIIDYEYGTLLVVIAIMFIAYTWLGNIFFN
ncbi:tetratricopeptide repeat protein [Winogradskyella sp.]|uniref:tetratricopeptide repeat protein n=1 Tax=Winogradskyella sp. TaxID=1883156 RepID=UPI0026256405|nr:tetratricopeptide repeat protein [Winogradskyella sp.]